MQTFLFIMCQTASVLLGLIAVAMILRLILSFFVEDEEEGEENRFLVFLALITEPITAPVRALLSVFGIGDDSPVDIGYYVALGIILILTVTLPAITL